MAGLYDQLRRDRRDERFYLRQSFASRGRVLELGCGTGRILAQIARAGVPVAGMDSSEEMLQVCRQAVAGLPPEQVHLFPGDMRSFVLEGEEAELVIIPHRTFQHLLSVEDQLACLACIRQCLEPGGRLALDLARPNFRHLASDPSPFLDSPVVLADGRAVVRELHLVEHDWVSQILTMEVVLRIDEESPLRLPLVTRLTTRWELEHLLLRAGFELLSVWGGFEGQPVAEYSQNLVVVARRAADV